MQNSSFPWASMATTGQPQATAYMFLYLGTFVFSVANGTLEAVANPLVSTLFPHNRTHYLNILHETREHSLAEFRKRDDQWLLSTDTEQFDSSDKVNIYWKWFHVCEHESHHTGQIAFLARAPANERIPVDKNEPRFVFKTEMACLFDAETGDRIPRE